MGIESRISVGRIQPILMYNRHPHFVTDLIELYFQGRMPPYPRAYEVSMGIDMRTRRQTQNIGYDNLTANPRDIRAMKLIEAGLFRREEVNVRIMKEFAAAVGTDLATLRRNARTASGRQVASDPYDFGRQTLLARVNREKARVPKRYVKAQEVGIGFRFLRKRARVSRQEVARQARVHPDMTAFLEHGSIPDDLLISPILNKVVGMVDSTVQVTAELGKEMLEKLGITTIMTNVNNYGVIISGVDQLLGENFRPNIPPIKETG